MTGTKGGAGRVAALLVDAERARRNGHRADAERLFGQVVEHEPANAAALNALGLMALEATDTSTAITYFAAAAAADPDAAPLWMNLAKTQRVAGDDAGERHSLHRALDTDQRHFMAVLRLAELHERLGETAAAVQRWDNVLAMARSMPDRPAALDDVLQQGAAFVARHQAAFGETIDTALSAARSDLDARDRRRFDACIDTMLGRRGIYANTCAGLHYPFLPADEFFDVGHFPWFAQIEAGTGAIRAELEAMLAGGEGFEPYVSMGPGAPSGKWTPLDRSNDWSAYHLWRHGAPIAEACARCPETAAALAAVPQAQMPARAPTAFFSILKPRTRIPAHTGVTNVRTIVHLPLIVPPGCGFRVGGETRAWEEGRAFAFDDTIEHEAWNDSNELRAVLIFDVWNPHLSDAERAMISLFYTAADASGHNPGQTAAIVD